MSRVTWLSSFSLISIIATVFENHIFIIFISITSALVNSSCHSSQMLKSLCKSMLFLKYPIWTTNPVCFQTCNLKARGGRSGQVLDRKNFRRLSELKKVTYTTTTIYIKWYFSNPVTFQNKTGEKATTDKEISTFFLQSLL